MEKIERSKLETALDLSWDEETSSDSRGWTERNPFRGLLKQEHRKSWISPEMSYKIDSEMRDNIGGTPSWGQCAVTALVVQDYLGGKLVRVPVSNVEGMTSHYFNELPDGTELDLTRSQFKGTGAKFGDKSYRERDYVLSPEFKFTIWRYNLLKNRVKEFLSSEGYQS